MASSDSNPNLRRRRFLQTATLLTGGGALMGSSRTISAQQDDLETWFANVSNYEGLVDGRGQSEVTIGVGASGNGGAFAYDPPAIRVDPGTTVLWEWTGNGGRHDVAAEDDSYGSSLHNEAGETFRQTFENEEVSKYACTPHKTTGMKGAVVVGDVELPSLETVRPPAVEREPEYGNWFDETDTFEETLDMRGRAEVRIQHRVDEAADEFAFSPPAIHIDPGTRVIWEWNGDGPSYRIESADDSYASPEQSTGEWGLKFDGVGISRYAATKYSEQGMRGAIVVGDVFDGVYNVSTSGLTVLGAFGAALLSPVAFGMFLWSRDQPADESDNTPR